MPFPLALALGIAGAAGQVASGLQQQAASAREARRNREFQERMRATQYQTAVEDMQKAGINPMLAYMQGGAGTPSGSVGQQEGFGDVVSSGVSSAVQLGQAKLLNEQMRLVKTQEYGKMIENASAAYRLGWKIGPDGRVQEQFEDSQIEAERQRAVLSNVELKAMADFWKHLGASGQGLKILGPLLLRLFGR